MKRRSFIRQSGIVAGGLLLHQTMAQAFSIPGAGKVRIGIIGCGDRGNGILEVLKELPDAFEPTAICDLLDFRIKETKRRLGNRKVSVYTDYHRLLDDKKVEAVIIATPLNLHYTIGSDALAAGKHVYLEKAMTFTIPEALDLVKKATAATGQVLQVGHQYRYTPLYYKVKEMISKGYLGKVMQVDCRWDRNWNWRRAVPDPSLERKINWRMYKEYSGGLAAELLSHQMDFIDWAFNTHPDTIYGTGGIDYYKDGRETFDNLQVTLRYDKAGMIGNFGATCGNARDGYLFKLKGTKGTVSLLTHEGIFYPEKETRKELETVDGVTGATKITWTKDGGMPILTEPTKDGTWYALQDFYKCIGTGAKPASNVITGATTAICVAMANNSAYNGVIEHWQPGYTLS